MSLQKLKQHEFIAMYLEYARATESPKIFHLWSALGSASACIGRHAYLATGIGELYPNIYTLLVGPPGTRKSQSLKYSSNLVRKYTQVRFAPDDTGSQRQGLLMALVGDEGDDVVIQTEDVISAAQNSMDATDLDALNSINVQSNLTDQHCLFAAASEFTTFMGNADSLTTALLNKVWDGESYDYRLKNERKVLKDSLMSIVGCTTPSEIARILPAESIGQGFMSRWILCFAPRRDRRVPLDEAGLDETIEPLIGEIFAWLYYELRGDIIFSKSANELQKNIYMQDKCYIEDSRFVYYAERRHTHLLKVAMLLAVLNRKSMVELLDIEMANILLKLTETSMPDALGEFGLSGLGDAKQKLLEFLQHVNEPVSSTVLYGVMSNDMKGTDFRAALLELEHKKKIIKHVLNEGVVYSYVDDLSDIWEDLVVIKDTERKII